jgi:hypothetical protein
MAAALRSFLPFLFRHNVFLYVNFGIVKKDRQMGKCREHGRILNDWSLNSFKALYHTAPMPEKAYQKKAGTLGFTGFSAV